MTTKMEIWFCYLNGNSLLNDAIYCDDLNKIKIISFDKRHFIAYYGKYLDMFDGIQCQVIDW